jgi:hypothetical protein
MNGIAKGWTRAAAGATQHFILRGGAGANQDLNVGGRSSRRERPSVAVVFTPPVVAQALLRDAVFCRAVTLA